jgi:hypothetical protein
MSDTLAVETRNASRRSADGLLPGGRARKAPLPEPLIGRFYAEDVSGSNVHGVGALEAHHCRYIINTDMASPIYCGEAIAHDRFSWCQKHFERCRGLGSIGERRAA